MSPVKTKTSEENVSHIREAFQWNLRRSIRAASLQLEIPCSTVRDVLHKRLHLRTFKIQMIHALKLSDQLACTNFTVGVLERIDVSPDFLHQVCFSDEVAFHVNGVVNRYNCRIWGSQNPNVTCELERGSCMRCPNYHLKLSSNKMGCSHISATMLGIAWTDRWLGNGSTEADLSLGPLGH
jgi:hypothetical protein